MQLSVSVIFLFLLSFVSTEFNLQGSKAFYVYPQTEHDFSTIKYICENSKIPGLHVWQYPYDSDVKGIFFVPRDSLKRFKKLMKKNSIRYEVFLENPEKTIKDNKVSESFNDSPVKINLKEYYGQSEIEDYMDELVRKHPKKLSVETYGRTWESRNLKYAKISTSFFLDKKKPVIFIDGGRIARFWMTSSIALYSMSKLVEDITESDIADKADWIIMPSVNPDGLEYSRIVDRFWDKSRSHTGNSDCLGVYIERNYELGWYNFTSDKCYYQYQGPEPFSEPETLVLKDIVEEFADRMKGYLSTSILYKGEVTYPFCYASIEPLNKQELVDLGTKMVKALNGLVQNYYTLSQMCQGGQNKASGYAADYVTLYGKVPLVYTINLRKFGDNIYYPPPTYIEPAVKETWKAIIVFARHIIEKYSG